MKVKQYTVAMTALVLIVGQTLASTAVNSAQQSSKGQPTPALDIRELMPDGLAPKVEVNITAPLLKMVVSATSGMAGGLTEDAQKMDPKARETILAVTKVIDSLGLRSLEVRVFGNIPADRQKEVWALADNAAQGLAAKGWALLVQVPSEHVCVATMEESGRIKGLVAIIAKGNGYMVMNLAADADPAAFGESLGSVIGASMNGKLSMEQMGMMLQCAKATAGQSAQGTASPAPAATAKAVENGQ